MGSLIQATTLWGYGELVTQLGGDPEFFEIGDDGALRVLNSAPAECHRAMIEEAVADCPTGALSIEG